MSKRCAIFAAYQCWISLWCGIGWFGTGNAGFLFLAGFAFGAAFVIAALGWREVVE